jgi:membrane protein implicated in regulation of membrane protease activity
MLLAGETLLPERLGTEAFLAIWLACFVFACLAMLVALLDVSAIRRRSREEQRTLFESTLQEIGRQEQAKRQKGLEPDEGSR